MAGKYKGSTNKTMPQNSEFRKRGSYNNRNTYFRYRRNQFRNNQHTNHNNSVDTEGNLNTSRDFRNNLQNSNYDYRFQNQENSKDYDKTYDNENRKFTTNDSNFEVNSSNIDHHNNRNDFSRNPWEGENNRNFRDQGTFHRNDFEEMKESVYEKTINKFSSKVTNKRSKGKSNGKTSSDKTKDIVSVSTKEEIDSKNDEDQKKHNQTIETAKQNNIILPKPIKHEKIVKIKTEPEDKVKLNRTDTKELISKENLPILKKEPKSLKPKTSSESSSSSSSSSSESSSSSSDEDELTKRQNTEKENINKKKGLEEVVYLGTIKNFEDLVESESGEDKKKVTCCLLCEKSGHTSFQCLMECKNCDEKYHNLKMCPKPPNLSIMLQNFFEFCLQQCSQYNPEKKFINLKDSLTMGAIPELQFRSLKNFNSSSTSLKESKKKKRKRKRGHTSNDDYTSDSESSSLSSSEVSKKKKKNIPIPPYHFPFYPLSASPFNPLTAAAMMGFNPTSYLGKKEK